MDKPFLPHPDPPDLIRWREHVLILWLLIMILASLPAIILSITRLLPQQTSLATTGVLMAYVIVATLLLSRRVSYQWRATLLVGANLLVATYLLLSVGPMSPGRIYIVTSSIIAALMLSRRAIILVWLAGASVLLLSSLVFATQSPAELVALAAYLGESNHLLANGIVTLTVSTAAMLGATSLVNRLNRSLYTTEQALAERDQANALLEQRVLDRTRELECAVDALRAGEAKYQTILQTTQDGFLVIDLQQRFLEVNDAYCALSGYSRSELLTMRISDIEAIEQPEETDARIRRIVDGGSARFESRHRRKDGSYFTVEISITFVTDNGGQLICSFRDISARKRAEQALERQLAIQAAVAHCSHLLIGSAPNTASQTQLLTEALSTIAVVHNAGYTAIMENVNLPELGSCAQAVVTVNIAQGNIVLRPLIQEPVPLEHFPTEARANLENGKPWGGPLTNLQSPLLREAARITGVQSVQSCPIIVSGNWWGTLLFADTKRERVWDSNEFQLLQMAAGIIGTAIKRWRTESELSLQLRYAEALARCSQTLLQPAESATELRAHMEEALTILREAVQMGRLYIFQPTPVGSDDLVLRVLADSREPGLASYIEPTTAQILDAPSAMHEALSARRWFGGPVPGRFSSTPLFQESLDQNGVQAILMVPAFLGDTNRSVLCALDCVNQREWDAPTVQLLRTATELLATVQQSWETNQALREREHLIKRVAETSPDRIQVLDLATRRSLFINRPFALTTGDDAAQLPDPGLDTLHTLVHPDDYARVMDHYARIDRAADGEILELEFRAQLGDQGERWFLSRDMIFARNNAGRPSQILSISQDVTRSKLTERALATSEMRLRSLRDALPDLQFVLSSDGVFREVYGARQHELLLPPEALLGRSIADVMPPAVSGPVLQTIEQVHASGKVGRVEYSLTIAEQERRFEARIVTVFDDELLVVERDITTRSMAIEALLQAKEAAEAADSAKSTFLAQVSHEIRTPLTAIVGMAGLLRESVLAPREYEHVTTINTAAETLLTIIGNILDFSKIEAGHMELSVQPFDPRGYLNGALDMVAHEAARKGLALNWKIDDVIPTALSGDASRIRQVIVNLLGNAVKFTERGLVTLTASGRPLAKTHFELVVSISDTGIGIAENQLQQIFEPFVQADTTSTRRFGGTGLGLAISKQIIELMEGRINVVSQPGAGATFTITLPLALTSATPAMETASTETGSGEAPSLLRVLLAEDNPLSQRVLSRLLESLGYMPDVVANGAEALAAVSSKPYDVVLMDIQMPELDGEAATRQIRALTGVEQPRIIALTASALRGDRERYLAAGMDDYISKPVLREDLRDALTRRTTSPSLSMPPTMVPGAGLIDWVMLDRLITSFGTTSADAAATVLGLFRATLGAQMEDLGTAVADDDRPRVRLLAHKLRGGSQQLGATLLAGLLSTLETACQGTGEPLDGHLARARRVYDETFVLLAERLEQYT